MEKLYIALVDTPGFFADIIRRVIKISYCHVALSFDADFQEAYSVGRRDPAIPFFAGFIRENTPKYCGYFQRHGIVSVNSPAQWNRKNCCGKK